MRKVFDHGFLQSHAHPSSSASPAGIVAAAQPALRRVFPLFQTPLLQNSLDIMPPAIMKKYIEYLILGAPILLWWLGDLLLGDRFALPNRLLLAVLCALAGAGALLAQRRGPGLLALLTGLGMLAAVPVEHDTQATAFTWRMGDYVLPQASVLDPQQVGAWLDAHPADLLSLKAAPAQVGQVVSMQAQYPYSYASCTAQGRSFLSRHPITAVEEQQRMGATQVRGALQAGDTALRFVVLDFSTLHGEADARTLAQEYLMGEQRPNIALIDTGDSGNRIPLEWISYVTGFTKSQRPMTAFTGSLDGGDDERAQVMLYAPALRCRAFDVTDLGIEATYSMQ
jgi:hypothetical protein